MGQPAEKDDENIFSNISTEQIDFGRADSLRYRVLHLVLSEKYEESITEMNTFYNTPSPFPNFNSRIERYIQHSIDLIHAIKAKKNFQGINSLTRAKQQELRDKYIEHFKELQQMIKKIEAVEVDLRVQDVRSTIYVVRALAISAISIVILAFTLEFFRGLAHNSVVVIDDVLGRTIDWIFNLIGL